MPRKLGLSRQKTLYIRELARHTKKGNIVFEQLPHFEDVAVIEQLTRVKGIGVWTAQMFLIFSLGRPNVFPHGDLAVRTALQKIYGMRKLPSKARMKKIAACWHPYASVGAWYCWRWHYIEGAYKPK